MRVSVVLGALAAAASVSASPLPGFADAVADSVADSLDFVKRAVVKKVDVVTQVVTVTAGANPAPTPVAKVQVKQKNAGGHHHYHYQKKPAPSPTPTPSPSPAPKPAVKPEQKEQTSSSGSSGYSAGSAPSSGDYTDSVVYSHNVHRANHSSRALAWDSGLASTAQKIASTCKYAHSMDVDGGGYGQNIAAGASANEIQSVISNQFYNNEMKLYPGYGSEPNMGGFEGWGHFSQLVWDASTKVGCYTQDCSGQGLSGTGSNVPPHYTVCNYGPQGNVQGHYAQNVKAPKNQPAVQPS